jgi:hypothetical protein
LNTNLKDTIIEKYRVISIKDFNCASCNKSFKYKSKLNEHEKTNKHLLQINKFIVNGNNHIGDNINTNNSYDNISNVI